MNKLGDLHVMTVLGSADQQDKDKAAAQFSRSSTLGLAPGMSRFSRREKYARPCR